jgi:hypothetical protein
VCAATALASSACARSTAPAEGGAAPGTAAATTTTQPPTLDTVSYVGEAQQARAEGTVPWFCRAQGMGGAMGHEDGLANTAYAGRRKEALPADECTKLAAMFDQIIAQVKPYRTRGDVKKAGTFSQAVQFVPGMGTHDMLSASSTGGFTTRMGDPPGPPMFLQYDGMGDDAPLAGMSWFTVSPGGPPEGFPGGNDWWHTHSTLCWRANGIVIGNEISDEECAKRGGANRPLPNVWMAHAWIIPGYEDRYDVFSGAYMCVKGTGRPPAAGDPCHDDHTDPEHGHGAAPGAPMPGMDHGATTTGAAP